MPLELKRNGHSPVDRMVRFLLLHFFSYPSWVSSTINNSVYSYLFFFNEIIYCKRKSFREKTIIFAEMNTVNSCKYSE